MIAPNFVDKTIWTGDNLDILRGMNSECVDLIYLDPPFNSNKNYEAPVGSKAAGVAFKDTWHLSDLDVAWMGLIADEQPAVANLLHTAKLTHGKGMQSYLTMMAVRLLEMHRVLKDTGSIYLHCDPTASHYLKLLMDSVFDSLNFRNELIWKRTSAHSDVAQGARHMGRIHDVILRFSKGKEPTWNTVYVPYDQQYIDSVYRYSDEAGRRYQTQPLHAAKAGGDTRYEWKGKLPPPGRYWAFSKENMERLDAEGRIAYSRTGTPRYKIYLDESLGKPLQDIWDDITAVHVKPKERLGYPTQKPEALLERIISASSNEGDVVLDPFCGCATACIAAEKLGRQWVGIDISLKAAELVNIRLQQAMGGLFHHGYVTARTDIPQRTDIEKPKPYRQNKHVLFGEQEGLCNGCKGDFPFKLYEVDHLVPKSKGGTDHLGNLQLLCGHCNRIKGDRPQEYLLSQLSLVAAF